MREPSDSAAFAAEILDGLGVRWALIGAPGVGSLSGTCSIYEQARRSR